ncbi:hypothetical protein GCM10025331_45990 [Actinoplanes utahensis]|nr:hypothetical protein Aut01nite_28460 [Actinoplanes utahensis]
MASKRCIGSESNATPPDLRCNDKEVNATVAGSRRCSALPDGYRAEAWTFRIRTRGRRLCDRPGPDEAAPLTAAVVPLIRAAAVGQPIVTAPVAVSQPMVTTRAHEGGRSGS